ncbi:MAG TPA: hypothetical protein EYP14_14900, partial [Planctomycetaceae bacterium]|nr:hypothetical protein [Planctomycetaceae bacterium]
METRDSIHRSAEVWTAGVVLAAVFGSAVCLSAATTDAAVWRSDFSEAWQEAQKTGRPLLVHFYADWCGPCR